MNGIHIIQGKATLGAGLMAAQVKGSGKYDYKVTEHNDKVCSIDFYQGKEKIGTSRFSIEDADKIKVWSVKSQTWVKLTDNNPQYKSYPANMLFARAMSNGAKWYTPDVFNGPVYTPEELQAVEVEDVQAEVINDDPNVTDALNCLNILTDYSELKDWSLTFANVLNSPVVKAAATAKKAQLKNEAK